MTLGACVKHVHGCRVLMCFILFYSGWFLLLSSLFGFWRVKHWEASIRATQGERPPTVEEIERDIAIRRTLENAFYLTGSNDTQSPQETEMRIQTRQEIGGARLHRELHLAGLL